VEWVRPCEAYVGRGTFQTPATLAAIRATNAYYALKGGGWERRRC